MTTRQASSPGKRWVGVQQSVAIGYLCLIFSLTAFTPSLKAQTLKEELNLLIQNHPSIEEARANLRPAQENVNSAKSVLYPSASVSGSLGREVVSNPTTRAANNDDDFIRFDTLGFQVRQKLYDGGAAFNTIDANRLTRYSMACTLSSTVQSIIMQGVTAYLNVVRLNELIRVARAREFTIKEQLDLETARVERGAGIEVDVLQAKSRLQLSTEQRVDLEGQLAQAMADYIQVFERARNDIDRAVRQAWSRLKNTGTRKELLLNAVAIAHEVFVARQKLRKAGKETSLNILDAEDVVFQAEQNLIRADYESRLSVYELAVAMGQLTPAMLGLSAPVLPDLDFYFIDPDTLEDIGPDEEALSRRVRQKPSLVPDGEGAKLRQEKTALEQEDA